MTRLDTIHGRCLLFGTALLVLVPYLAEGCGCPVAHHTWEGKYPEDWESFKSKVGSPLIHLPPDAHVTRLERGEAPYGVSIQIWFTLPATKSPPEWMLAIARESGAPDKRVKYLDRRRRKYVEVNDLASLDMADASRQTWAIGFAEDLLNGGSLRYEPGGTYDYCWTND